MSEKRTYWVSTNESRHEYVLTFRGRVSLKQVVEELDEVKIIEVELLSGLNYMYCTIQDVLDCDFADSTVIAGQAISTQPLDPLGRGLRSFRNVILLVKSHFTIPQVDPKAELSQCFKEYAQRVSAIAWEEGYIAAQEDINTLTRSARKQVGDNPYKALAAEKGGKP